eukprot:3995741-Amphidinium_carterae.1
MPREESPARVRTRDRTPIPLAHMPRERHYNTPPSRERHYNHPGLDSYVRPTAKAMAKQAAYKPSHRMVGKQSPPIVAQLDE